MVAEVMRGVSPQRTTREAGVTVEAGAGAAPGDGVAVEAGAADRFREGISGDKDAPPVITSRAIIIA
jgi:hypothetical protein